MKKLLLCLTVLSGLAALPGCQSIPEDPNKVAAAETEYVTGSNIPRKKSSANTTTMTIDNAEDMRRAAEAQRSARQ